MLKPLTVSLCVAFALAACQQNTPPVAPTATDTPPTAPATPESAPATVPSDTAPTADAAAPATADDSDVITSQWKCGDQEFTATYNKRADNLEFAFAGKKLVLPSAVSASGARYADTEGNEFWEHQGEATLKLTGEENSVSCTPLASSAL